MTKGKGLRKDVYEIEIFLTNGVYTVNVWRLHTYGVFLGHYEGVSHNTMVRLTSVLNAGFFGNSDKKWEVLTSPLTSDTLKVRYVRASY